MRLTELNARDDEIQRRALNRIKVIKGQRHDERTARAMIREALTARDNERGDMLRAFLKRQ